jgi:di-N-acetylchitobiase
MKYVILLFVCVFVADICNAQCPCTVAEYCQPITTQYEHEIFAFTMAVNKSTWEKYDWDKMTTIAIGGFYDAELLCHAHRKNVRVVNIANFPVGNLTDSAARASWIAQQVAEVQRLYLDGINIDTEDAIDAGSPEVNALTQLVQETKEAFHSAINGSQVTFDIAWSPDGIDGRNYDAVGLSQAADFLFVMSYDEQSQIFTGPCTARANAGYNKTVGGLEKFFALGISPSKLVLGVPWYGYNYPCINLTENNTCYIASVPFRGVNCSDAAGKEYNYDDVLDYLQNSTTGRLWNEATLSPYFNFMVGDEPHQMWYDDPESLLYKYQYAVRTKLRGVGMWNAIALDYSDTIAGAEQRAEMWGLLPSYRNCWRFNHISSGVFGTHC